MQQCIKIHFIFVWSSTCFGRHTVHHQEPKTKITCPTTCQACKTRDS